MASPYPNLLKFRPISSACSSISPGVRPKKRRKKRPRKPRRKPHEKFRRSASQGRNGAVLVAHRLCGNDGFPLDHGLQLHTDAVSVASAEPGAHLLPDV